MNTSTHCTTCGWPLAVNEEGPTCKMCTPRQEKSAPLRPITIKSRYQEGACSGCGGTITLDLESGNPVEVIEDGGHEDDCPKAVPAPLIAITPTDYFGQEKGETKLFASVTEAFAEVARLVSYPDTKVLLANTILEEDGEWGQAPYAFAQVSREGWYNLTEVLS